MDPIGFDILDLSGKDGRVYNSNSPHRHTFFELFFFESGKGRHEIDFNLYPVSGNSVHFVSPGQIHQLSIKNTLGFVVCFTEDFISLKSRSNFPENYPFYNGSGDAVLKLTKELAKEISFLVSSLSREIRLFSGDQTELIHSYLNIILLKLRSLYLQHKKNLDGPALRSTRKITQFKKLINERFLKHEPLSTYARVLGVSPNYLNALCKKHEGKTAIQLIQERLLLESKRLLYATDMDIKEISFYLQFEDVSYYNRFFKKLTHLTPVQYREHSRKNH